MFNVEFTTDLADPTEAHIEFGRDPDAYEYSAPVDLAEPGYKTPLLGMKPLTEYHYRVVVSSAAGTCMGNDRTVETGAQPSSLPPPIVDTPSAAGLAGGFMIGEFYAGSQQRQAFILDKDAAFVWWFDPRTVVGNFGDLARARMSQDGKYMWIAHTNVPSQNAHMLRVRMDGSGGEEMSGFTRLTHDFVILPDDSIYFLAYAESGNCPDVVKYNPAGAPQIMMNLSTAFTSGACFANAIEYSAEDDTLVVSDIDHDAYVKLNRSTGAVVWVLGGGSDNDFTGTGATWDGEFGLHMLGENEILFFNTGDGSSTPSKAIEVTLNPGAGTATKTWEYVANPEIRNLAFGDVQRLSNGNTLVSYSTQGIVHEVAPDKTLLRAGSATERPTVVSSAPRRYWRPVARMLDSFAALERPVSISRFPTGAESPKY